MPRQSEPAVFVDLTGNDDDDSLSEPSDAEALAAIPSSKSKSKANPKPASRSSAKSAASLKKSASSSNLSAKSSSKPKATADASSKPKARKSEPIPLSDAHGDHADSPSKDKPKSKEQSTPTAKAGSSRSAPISDIVRARTHVNCEGNPAKLCHQHHQPCKGALLECTFMRAPGKRCQGRYCFSSLKRFYDMDPETIVKSNRMMINPSEHCPPSETKYAWKCPRCRGKCACSTCRKAAGLEPLGKWVGGTKHTKPPAATDASADADAIAADGNEAKPKKGKAKAKTDGASEEADNSKSGVQSAAKSKAKGRTIAEAIAAGPKQGAKGKGKASKASVDADGDEDDDGISTPPPPGGSKSAPKKTLASLLTSTTVRAPLFKPLKPPTEAPPPVFEVIPTKLPEENMRARMWIYESMVRFDKFGLNRTVLSQLDRLDNWTHAMAQDMLACLLKTVAGMSNIEKGQPVKPFTKVITAYRNHGKSLQRGEPWSAAAELLAILGLSRIPLPFVEHDIPVEVEAAAAQRSPSPPAARVTRARRAKENNQYEIARQLSLLDQWEDDEFGETIGEAQEDDDDEDALPSKRRRAPAKKSIYVYDDPSDDESMADPDDNARGRRASGRARKPVQKEAAPEVRLTGRQQAIKLQQEEEAKQRKQEEEEARAAKESRKRQASTVSKGTASDASDNEDAKHPAHANGHSRQKRRKLTAGSSDNEAESDEEPKEDEEDADAKSAGATGATDEKDVEQDQREMESPDLETKVSILAALIDAAVMADGIAEELKTAAENIATKEREHRASYADMEKEIVAELAELNKRAPSIVSQGYQEWKAEKQQLEQDIAYRRQEARVVAELEIDTHALRTGPIGHDADGREYWHLREYQERMPKFTEGKYAWCLVVLGPAFPADPNRPVEEEAKPSEADVSMADVGNGSAKDGADADDSGLTSLDGASDAGKGDGDTEGGNVKLGLPTSLQNGDADSASASKSEANGVEGAKANDRICMGANDPMTIKQLIDYVTYRLERIEYEENVAMQEREKEARLAKESDDASASASPAPNGEGEGAESMYAIRKAKQTLKDTQEERRRQVEQLVKRLTKSKEYFAWHREELAP